MKVNWHTPGIVWFEHAAENAAIAAATVALSLMTPGGETHAPWQTIALLSGKAAVYAILLAVVSLRQNNGTASFLPNIQARRKPRTKPAP